MAFPPKKEDGPGGGGHSPVAAILLKLKHGGDGKPGEPGAPGGSPAGGGDDLEFVMQDFISAVKSGDAAAAANLFRSMSDLATGAPEPDADDAGEGGGVPPEGDAGGPPKFPMGEE